MSGATTRSVLTSAKTLVRGSDSDVGSKTPVQKMTLRISALPSFTVIISWTSCITRALNTSFAQAWGATNGHFLSTFLTRPPTAVRL
jgi:hypothetical protein